MLLKLAEQNGIRTVGRDPNNNGITATDRPQARPQHHRGPRIRIGGSAALPRDPHAGKGPVPADR
jgi:hypothetical protein